MSASSGELSRFQLAVFSGRWKIVQDLLAHVEGDAQAKKVMLESRVSPLRSSMTMIAIVGSRICMAPPEMAAQTDYVKVMTLLLEHDVRVDSRDVVGRTLIHYATAGLASQMTLQMADLCIAKDKKDREKAAAEGAAGAGSGPAAALVDLQDRFGEVALCGSIMSQSVEALTFLAVTHLADPHIGGYGAETTPFKMAQYHPNLGSVISKGLAKSSKKDGDFGKCAVCGAEEAKVCSRCKCVHYCSAQCQTAHWKKHKKQCKEWSEKIWRITPYVHSGSTASLTLSGMKDWTGKAPKTKAFGDDFDCKIQVPLQQGTDQALVLYDRQRSWTVMIGPENCSAVNEIEAVIRAEGQMGGLKGYFRAVVVEKGVLHVWQKMVNHVF
jgi:hypothetical protein